MNLYVIRHAHAGSRSAWNGPDERRPLSPKGHRQANAIADRLAAAGVTRLVSSPARRCTESLDPLACRLGLTVEADDRLSEGADGAEALALAEELRAVGDAAVCSHGDVIPDLLRRIRARGTTFPEPFVWPKGSVWVVTGEAGEWTTASYLPPPRV